MPNSFDLEQFVRAQEQVMPQVLRELRAGHKRSHWMWFVFPQLLSLGHSMMSRQYGIPSLAAAQAYLAHPLLGKRLMECTRLTLQADQWSALAFFGSPDDMKFHSSMTLFDRARPDACFREALDRFFHGKGDPRTLEILRMARGS
ncbi:DUF1810 domain-containing protein [Acidisoma silvae]|uniref:DUF1810 domain-containing protein n=1 Tax=Acidisoma silvae TaxID=2802396 RepID=A0A963YPH8_9PROT|nr:DUF1810 domain-containing protein [Acidisoma silvae]MCB8874661.1 DUF1810 domain-containing protein [Acidisoma silvae]